MKLALVPPYQGKSLIASAQKAINLYSEKNKEGSPFPTTEYPTPGSLLFSAAVVPNGGNGTVRCTYRTTIGTAYIVVGPTIYFLSPNGALTVIGTIADRPNQVYMSDNGLVVVLVDGTSSGYAIDINSNAFGIIIDPSFYGADFVAYLDTFFVFNRPTTDQFYISLSLVNFALLTSGTSFDPLDIAAKSGSADPIVAILVVHQYLWLVGALTTEIWIGSGAADFFFQQVQGAYIDHGCIAPYSASNQDVSTFWLMEDKQGSGIIVMGTGFEIKEISTPFIVSQIKSYVTMADAIGFCFQMEDHAYYAIIFPTANTGWLYDLTTDHWCEWNYTDNNGVFNRPRANCAMFVFGKNFVGDWQTGQILQLDINTYTDNGQPITRVRTFQHLFNDGDRVIYKNFIASMEVGTANPADPNVEFFVFLECSDDAGKTFGQAVAQSLGNGGEYLTQPSWNRLGMSRDRVFKLSWSAPFKTALNGGFVDAVRLKS